LSRSNTTTRGTGRCFALFGGGPFISDIQLDAAGKRLVNALESAGVLAKGADRLAVEKLARYFIRTFKDIQIGKNATNIKETLGADLQKLDEEQVFRQAATNLQERCVRSKHMRHDGAMQQAAPEVWSKATSLKAAKAELCSKFPEPEVRVKRAMRETRKSMDMDMAMMAMASVDSMEVKSCSMAASAGAFRKKATKSSLMSSLSSWLGTAYESSRGVECDSADAECGSDETVRSFAGAPMPGSMPAPMPPMAVKTLGTNIEDAKTAIATLSTNADWDLMQDVEAATVTVGCELWQFGM